MACRIRGKLDVDFSGELLLLLSKHALLLFLSIFALPMHVLVAHGPKSPSTACCRESDDIRLIPMKPSDAKKFKGRCILGIQLCDLTVVGLLGHHPQWFYLDPIFTDRRTEDS